jgi:general secretion pathway protein H
MTQTSATGARNAGFTLIELLVVLVIVGITLGLITLSIRSPSQQNLDQEASRLAAVMTLAVDEAQLSSKPVLLQLDREGWRFLEAGDVGLVPVPDSILPAGRFGTPLDRIGLWPPPASSGEGSATLQLWLGREAVSDPTGLVLERGGQTLLLQPDGLGSYRWSWLGAVS